MSDWNDLKRFRLEDETGEVTHVGVALPSGRVVVEAAGKASAFSGNPPMTSFFSTAQLRTHFQNHEIVWSSEDKRFFEGVVAGDAVRKMWQSDGQVLDDDGEADGSNL